MSQNYTRRRRSTPNNPAGNPGTNSANATNGAIDAEQQEMGNNFALEQTPLHMQSPPPASPYPWNMDLFGSGYAGQIDGLAWDGNMDMSSNVDGGIRSKQQTSSSKRELGKGAFGDVTHKHTNILKTYKDSDIDVDVDVAGTKKRKGKIDGMKYSENLKRDVGVSGGVKHEKGQDIANGNIGIDLGSTRKKSGQLKTADYNLKQKQEVSNKLSGGWENKEGVGTASLKYTHGRKNEKSLAEKLSNGEVARENASKSKTSVSASRNKKGTAVKLGHDQSGSSSFDRTITNDAGVKVNDKRAGNYDASVDLGRTATGALSAKFDGKMDGNFGHTTEQKNAAGATEIFSVTGNGAIAQQNSITKNSRGKNWENHTNASGKVDVSKAVKTETENGNATKTLYAGADAAAVINREKDGVSNQQYNVGAHVGQKQESMAKKDNVTVEKMMDNKFSVANESTVDEKGKVAHQIDTKLGTEGAHKTTTDLADGNRSVNWTGEAGLAHRLKVRESGNSQVLSADAKLAREVKRVKELEDGKRTNKLKTSAGLSEDMSINKDGKVGHRLKADAGIDASTQRVIDLEDGKRTNTLKGNADISRTLRINQDGSKSHTIDSGLGVGASTKRVTNMDDGKKTTNLGADASVGHTLKIDKDGKRSNEYTGKVSADASYERDQKIADGTQNTTAGATASAQNTMSVDADGKKTHEALFKADGNWGRTKNRTVTDGTIDTSVAANANASDAISIDAEGKRSHLINLGAGVEGLRTRKRNLDDGSLEHTASGKANVADAISIDKDGKRSHTVDGKVEGALGRKRVHQLADGSLTTNLKGTASAADKMVIDEQGVAHAIDLKVGTEGDRTRQTTLADGTQTNKLKGSIGASDKITIGPDGVTKHKLGAEGTVGASRKRITNLDNGKDTREMSIDQGIKADHVIGEGNTNIALNTGAKLSTVKDRKVSDAVTTSDTVSHEATMKNNMSLLHSADKGFDLDHKQTDIGYALGKGSEKHEVLADRTVDTAKNQKYSATGTIKDDAVGAKLGYDLSKSTNVKENNGSSLKDTKTLAANVGVDRKTAEESGVKQNAYNLAAGLKTGQTTSTVTKTADGTRKEDVSSSHGADIGYDTKAKLGTLGLSRSNSVEKKDEHGVESFDKRTQTMTFDTKGNRTTGYERDILGYRKTEEINDKTSVTTDKNRLTVGASSGTKKNEDGSTSYVGEAKASYTALSQTVKFADPATYEKIKGLKMGDRDTDDKGKVRTLQKSLNKLGYRIVEDGVYGAGTLNAVKDVAAKKGIPLDNRGTITGDLAFALPRVGLLGEGVKAEASYEAGKVEGKASVDAKFTKEQVKVKGAVGAKVTMIGGNAKIDLPVTSFTLGGEKIQAAVTMGVNAAVLAELDGQVDVDIGKGNDSFNAGFGGKAEAFAGVKGGAEVGAEFRWMRGSSNKYGEDLKKFAKSIPGKVDDWVVDQLPPEFWPQLSSVLVGSGTSRVLYAKAGVEGRAGIGGSASFAGGFKDGMVHFSGNMSGTIGLGGGVKTDFGVNVVDGARLGGIWGIRGINYISDHLSAAANWSQEVLRKVQQQIDAYMEAKKAKGGFWGTVMKGVDFVGDDLLKLW